MKNYYEILEINEKASQEIIEKVYKVLVKKYHPDLQENAETKAKYEEKIKQINEAYDVLSDEQKRKEYDEKLAQEKKEKQYQQDYQNAINQSYHNAYIQNLKNRGYKIRYKKTKKDYLRSLIALLITIGIMALVFQLPFVKNYFSDLYNNNSAFKGFIDFFANMFK